MVAGALIGLQVGQYDFPNLKKKHHFSGVSSVQAIKYPMKVLGGKSHPALNNLKQFIKVS